MPYITFILPQISGRFPHTGSLVAMMSIDGVQRVAYISILAS